MKTWTYTLTLQFQAQNFAVAAKRAMELDKRFATKAEKIGEARLKEAQR